MPLTKILDDVHNDPGVDAKREVIERIAGEIAPQLDVALNEYLHGRDAESDALEHVLWDNKVGILRVLQYVAEQGKIVCDVGYGVPYDGER